MNKRTKFWQPIVSRVIVTTMGIASGGPSRFQLCIHPNKQTPNPKSPSLYLSIFSKKVEHTLMSSIFARPRALARAAATLMGRPHHLRMNLIRPAYRRFSLTSLPDDGVKLREGTFLARLHGRARTVIDQGFVLHSSKLLILVSCFTLDWTTLRVVLTTSSFM